MCVEKVNKEIAIFNNPEFGKIRVVMREGEPWFVAIDVANILQFANASDAIKRHCKKSIKSSIVNH